MDTEKDVGKCALEAMRETFMQDDDLRILSVFEITDDNDTETEGIGGYFVTDGYKLVCPN